MNEPTNTALRHLVYRSSATGEVSDETLEAIRRTACSRNQPESITGFLLFADGCFLQLLEGPPEAVGELYTDIQRDPRHHALELLLDAPCARRSVPNWSMGVLFVDDQINADRGAMFVLEQALGHQTLHEDVRRTLVAALQTDASGSR
ncbi:MAG: hypothetical protein Tsb0013_00810 [Phycisphaerales bacterium]